MKEFRKYYHLIYRWVDQVADPAKIIKGILRYGSFFRDWVKYINMKGAESIRFINTYPRVHEKTATTGFEMHYFYQNIWAFKKICESAPDNHYDIGSSIDYISYLTAITRVTFIDIRPLMADLDNFETKKGSIISLPYEDNSLASLSCLHVAEHIGLGRYGDPIDPLGTKKACLEMTRVLARAGNLYFALPVGKPRLCYNAHRIHSPRQILDYFHSLELVEFSGIDDNGKFLRDIDISVLESADYGCGLFWFRKK